MDKMLVSVGGRNYSGWKNISVRASMESLAHGFQVSLADIGPTDISKIIPGEPLTLIVDQDGFQTTVFSGFVDDRNRTRAGGNTSLEITGRSKTADLVDCSAIYGNNTFIEIDFTKMAEQLAKPFGIKVVSYLDPGEKIKNYTIKNGASVFSVLEENARKVGALLSTNWDGDLVLSYADAALRSDADLVDGVNVQKLSEKWSAKKRHSKYIFKGQATVAGGKPWESDQTIAIKKEANDPGVTRYRPKIVTPSGKMNSTELQQTANWEAQVRTGRSKYYVAEVDGWFQGTTGQPWQINSVANLYSSDFEVDTLFLITEVEFTKDEKGTTSSITLKDPRTYREKPEGGF